MRYKACAILVAATAVWGTAAAQMDEVKTYNGIEFACTGVAESAQDPRWKTFPLKLVFSGAGGGFVSDIAIDIVNRAGEKVFETRCEYEPWLVAKLAPGEYTVTAVAEGAYSKTFDIGIKSGRQTYRVIRYAEIKTR